jgi:hypothetical protein
MPKAITGAKFGKLTLKKIIKKAPRNGDKIWRCICVCGGRVNRAQRRLDNEYRKCITSSCGCNGYSHKEKRRARCQNCQEDHYTTREYHNYCHECFQRAWVKRKVEAHIQEGANKPELICDNCNVKHFKDYEDGFNYCTQCRKSGKIRKILPLEKRTKEIHEIKTPYEVKFLLIPNKLIREKSVDEITECFVQSWEVTNNTKISEEIAKAIRVRVICSFYEREVILR